MNNNNSQYKKGRGGRNNRRRPLSKTKIVNQEMHSKFPVRRNLSIGYNREYLTKLKYSTDFLMSAASANFQYTYRLLSGLYDPDDGGSGNDRNYTYFNNLAQIYDSYLVERVHYKLQLTNLEEFPVTFTTCPSVNDLSTELVSGAAVQDLAENYLGKKVKVTGLNARGVATITGSVDMADMIGGFIRYQQEDFRGFYNSNPFAPIYQFMGVFADSNITQGCQVSLTYVAQVRFTGQSAILGQTTIPPTFKASRASFREARTSLPEKIDEESVITS